MTPTIADVLDAPLVICKICGHEFHDWLGTLQCPKHGNEVPEHIESFPCKRCGVPVIKTDRNMKYCPQCKTIALVEQMAKGGKKYRERHPKAAAV